MKKADFKKATKDLKPNDKVRIHIRGSYTNFTVEGTFVKVNEDTISVMINPSIISSKSVISITKI